VNINDHRDEIAAAICADLPCINYDKGVAGGCTSCDEATNHLLASPALARLLAAARDEARGEALRDAARFFEYDMAPAWGGDARWISTGSHVADLVASILRERADETADGAA